MAAPPRFSRFFSEDYSESPEWFKRFLTAISELIGSTVSALSGRLTREDNILSRVVAVDFTTLGTVANTYPLKFKNKLGVKPRNAWMGQFRKYDGATLSGPWSLTWAANQNDELEVTFQGLEASTRYVGFLIYEP